MKKLTVFEQREVLGKDFKIYGDAENPLFLAKDVAQWIEHQQPTQLVENVDDNEKLMCLINTSGQKRNMWFLTEYGLYEVLMQSRKPIAKEFKKQVKQILREIRQYGIYAEDNIIDKIIMKPEFGIKLLTELKTEREKRYSLEQKINIDRPLITFANAVTTSKTSILIGDLAKILKQNGHNIGQNRLFEWLRQNGYLVKCGSSRNMPTQSSMELGLFQVKENTINNPDGSVRIIRTTKVTGKGQIYFINLFKEEKQNGKTETTYSSFRRC